MYTVNNNTNKLKQTLISAKIVPCKPEIMSYKIMTIMKHGHSSITRLGTDIHINFRSGSSDECTCQLSFICSCTHDTDFFSHKHIDEYLQCITRHDQEWRQICGSTNFPEFMQTLAHKSKQRLMLQRGRCGTP